MMTKVCETCGNSFKPRRKDARFCSSKCYGQWLSTARPDSIFKAPHRKMKPDVVCESCGKVIPNARQVRRFCDAKCFGQWNGRVQAGTKRPSIRGVDRTCEICGTVFHVGAGLIEQGGGRFCSRTCQGLWNRTQPSKRKGRVEPKRHKRVTLKCEVCEKSFVVQVNEAQGRRFCSKKCMSKHQSESGEYSGPANGNWKGGPGPTYYGPNWLQQRRNARARDKYTCQRCGKHEHELKRNLDVHHIVPFRSFGVARYKEANTLRNLVSLCGSCHIIVEPRHLL